MESSPYVLELSVEGSYKHDDIRVLTCDFKVRPTKKLIISIVDKNSDVMTIQVDASDQTERPLLLITSLRNQKSIFLSHFHNFLTNVLYPSSIMFYGFSDNNYHNAWIVKDYLISSFDFPRRLISEEERNLLTMFYVP